MDKVNFKVLGDGTCTVLIHAIGMNLNMWNGILSDMERDGRKMVLYDIRGHGGTAEWGDDWTLEMFAEDLSQLLNAINVETASIIGHSLGGMIAQVFALNNPSRVEKLILSSTTSGQTPESRQALYDRAKKVETAGMESIADGTVQRWFTPDFIKRNKGVVESVKRDLLACSPLAFAKATRAIAGLDLWDHISNITSPTMVMTGAEDPGTDANTAREMHNRIPHSQLRIIADASHMTPIEQGKVFTENVNRFLNE